MEKEKVLEEKSYRLPITLAFVAMVLYLGTFVVFGLRG